jgi:hypothetical protein
MLHIQQGQSVTPKFVTIKQTTRFHKPKDEFLSEVLRVTTYTQVRENKLARKTG